MWGKQLTESIEDNKQTFTRTFTEQSHGGGPPFCESSSVAEKGLSSVSSSDTVKKRTPGRPRRDKAERAKIVKTICYTRKRHITASKGKLQG